MLFLELIESAQRRTQLAESVVADAISCNYWEKKYSIANTFLRSRAGRQEREAPLEREVEMHDPG